MIPHSLKSVKSCSSVAKVVDALMIADGVSAEAKMVVP